MSSATGSSFSSFSPPIQVSFHVDGFEFILWAIKSALETSKDFSPYWLREELQVTWVGWVTFEFIMWAARGDSSRSLGGPKYRLRWKPGSRFLKVSAVLETWAKISWVETCPKISPHSPRFTGTSLSSVGGLWISVVIICLLHNLGETQNDPGFSDWSKYVSAPQNFNKRYFYKCFTGWEGRL